MYKLYLFRGVSGAGKTTAAESLCDTVFSADDYFMEDGIYKFNPTKLKQAHANCLDCVRAKMHLKDDIAVANTFTQEWEMEKYYAAAEEFGYTVFSLIVENRHNGVNVHGVPDETLAKMKDRFEVVL